METAVESPQELVHPETDVGTRTEKFVTFQLGDHVYAVPAAAVAEVTHPLPVTPLPYQPRALAGISPLRGEVVAAVDLRGLLGETMAQSPKTKQIILRSALEGAAPISFVVDRLGEISAIDIDSISRCTNSEFLDGEVETDGGVLRMVNHSELSYAIDPDR